MRDLRSPSFAKSGVVFAITLVLFVDLGFTMTYSASPLRMLHKYSAGFLVPVLLAWSVFLAASIFLARPTEFASVVAAALFVIAAAISGIWMAFAFGTQSDDWRHRTEALLATDDRRGFTDVTWKGEGNSSLFPCVIVEWHVRHFNTSYGGTAACAKSQASLSFGIHFPGDGTTNRSIWLKKE